MHKDVGKRVMALLLSICMIAGMVDWSGFTVRAAEERYHLSQVIVNTQYTYNGQKKEPKESDITVKVQQYDENGDWRGSPLVELTPDMGSYTITGYGENINANIPSTVRVRGDGNIEGDGTGTFTIAPLEISGVQWATIGVEGIIYVTKPGTVTPSPVLSYEYESGRFLSLSNTKDYTYSHEGNEIKEGEGVKDSKIKVIGKGNYTGTLEIPFEIHMLDTSKLTLELKTGATLKQSDPSSNGLPRVDYDGTRKELDKGKDVTVKYENDVLNADEFVLEYNSDNLSSAGVVEVKARAISGKYAGITTEDGKEYMIQKWLDENRGNPIQITIPDQSYPGSGGTLKIPLDGSENSLKFVDPDARDEIKNKPLSEKIEVTVPAGWEKIDANQNGIIEWYANIFAKDGSGYKGNLELTASTQVPFNIVAPSLTTLPITISQPEYDGTTKWLDEVEKDINNLIKVGDGKEYVQGTDFTVRRKVSTDTGLGAGTYTIVISAKDGGKIRPGSVEKSFTVTPKSMLDTSGIQIVVNSGSSLVYNGSPHHPLPQVKV